MAFWTKAATSQPSSRPAGPAKPVTVVLHAPGNFNTLVRLKIQAPSAPAATSESQDADEAGHAAADAAMSKLHRLIMDIESKSADARKHSITEVLSPQDMQLQLLCQKAVAPKMYKSLMPQQNLLGFSLGDVKSCISLTPLGSWELHEALQTAVIKALTGSSCGTCNSSSSAGAAAGSTLAGGTGGSSIKGSCSSGTAAAAAAAATEWMCLSRYKLVGCNLLASQPGNQGSAVFVEFEAKGQPPNKVLLLVKSAGMMKFRLFSPMQTLSAEPKAIQHPLLLSDSDAALLGDSSKLAAAARQLDGRAVKLLPDERQAFIKSLKPCPSNPSDVQQLSDYWLGHYGLQLPTTFPFLVGVASDPEAESASLEVPSCCVLTNLGLSVVPGSNPGGSCYKTGMQQLLQGLQGSQLRLLGSEGFKVEAAPAAVAGGPGISDALMQIGSQAGSQAGAAAVAAAAAAAAGSSNEAGALQPKHFSLAANWTTAKDISKLQDVAKAEAAKAAAAADASKHSAGAGAAKSQQQQQQQQKADKQPQVLPSTTTNAAAQLLGLQEITVPAEAADNNDSSSTGNRQRPVLGARQSGKDYSKLREYVIAKQQEQQEQQRQGPLQIPGRAAGTAAAARAGKPSSSSSGGGGGLPGRPPALAAAAAAATAGPHLVRKFGGRKPGVPAAAAAKPAAKRPPAGASASLIAAVKAAAAAAGKCAASTEPAAAAAAAQPTVAKPVAAAGMKRPAAGEAATAGDGAVGAKQPAAKKAKAADGIAASKPKAPGKKKAAVAAAAPAAAAGAAGSTAAGTGVAAAAAAASDPAAAVATAAPERKRTKASDLDLAAVTAKVLAAYAAGGGSSLKGVSVPEMQCYLRSQGQRGGPTKKAEVEARLLALLATTQASK